MLAVSSCTSEIGDFCDTNSSVSAPTGNLIVDPKRYESNLNASGRSSVADNGCEFCRTLPLVLAGVVLWLLVR